ncbi:MAG: acyloxyacyl hydrolase [Terriglobales bacterium]
MTPLGDGKAYLALTLINQEPRKIALSSALLIAGLAIFAPPLASAQQRGYNPLNLALDSVYSGGRYQCAYYDQYAGVCDLVEFNHDNAGGGTPDGDCYGAGLNACPPNGSAVACAKEGSPGCGKESPARPGKDPGEDSNSQPSNERLRRSKPADFNREIYYRNKLEFSLDGGWLPINIPFPLDVFVGGNYNTYPLKYTLVPIIASLRWHINGVGGPVVLRGNWDLTCSGSVTAIPRGPETRYFAYIMGIRRNFVPRNWRVAPYWDIRLGVGNIDAKGPAGVKYAQGETLTFTVGMGSGVRYNFSPRFSISAGLNFMHISNLDLSNHVPTGIDPHWGTPNYGINVYGPMVGIDIQLRRHQRQSEH